MRYIVSHVHCMKKTPNQPISRRPLGQWMWKTAWCMHSTLYVFCDKICDGSSDPTFAPAIIAPPMILRQQRVRVRVMIGFLVRGRARIKIKVRVRVAFNVGVYHWSNCRRSKCNVGHSMEVHVYLWVHICTCSTTWSCNLKVGPWMIQPWVTIKWLKRMGNFKDRMILGILDLLRYISDYDDDNAWWWW